MSEGSNDGTARKRRRRRRRGKPAAVFVPVAESSPDNPATITPQMVVAAADEPDDMVPLAPGRARGGSITLDLRARDIEMLEWVSRNQGMTVEGFATKLLRGQLTGMRPAYREAMTGRTGGTISKAALNRMIDG